LHPDTQKEIRAGVGRFGPYIVHEKDFRSLKKDDNVLTVDFKRAMELLSAPKGGRRRGSQVIKNLGEHPTTKEPVEILEGPYGLYVKHGKINATVPKEKKAEDLTMEEAVKLLADKEASAPAKTKRKIRSKR